MEYFCPKCGERLTEDSAFCTNCGNEVSSITNASDVSGLKVTEVVDDAVDYGDIDYGAPSLRGTATAVGSGPVFSADPYRSGAVPVVPAGVVHSDTLYGGDVPAGSSPYYPGVTALQPQVGLTQTQSVSKPDHAGLIAGIVALIVGLAVVGVAMFFLITSNARTDYTVVFETSGGSIVSEVQVEKGGRVYTPTDPTRSGYTFGGWYLDAALTKRATFPVTIEDDTVLYAKWVEAPSTSTAIPTEGDTTVTAGTKS